MTALSEKKLQMDVYMERMAMISIGNFLVVKKHANAKLTELEKNMENQTPDYLEEAIQNESLESLFDEQQNKAPKRKKPKQKSQSPPKKIRKTVKPTKHGLFGSKHMRKPKDDLTTKAPKKRPATSEKPQPTTTSKKVKTTSKEAETNTCATSKRVHAMRKPETNTGTRQEQISAATTKHANAPLETATHSKYLHLNV